MSEDVNISMADKAGLLAQPSGVTVVPLKKGAEYGQETIRGRFLEELGKLYELRLYPRPPEEEPAGFTAGVTLCIQNDAPAINMILWEIEIRSDYVNGVFYMDDQTGKILSFSFAGAGSDNPAYTEERVKAWASYLGADVRNIKKGPVPEETPGTGLEVVYLFELYSGPMGVSGQMSSLTHTGEGEPNRWGLSYTQVNYDRIEPQ
jgi:hypothetical protein